jgi:hypothetical protein
LITDYRFASARPRSAFARVAAQETVPLRPMSLIGVGLHSTLLRRENAWPAAGLTGDEPYRDDGKHRREP